MKDNKKKPQTNLRPYVLCPFLVRIGRLELPLREELDPKSSAATNYATSANLFICWFSFCYERKLTSKLLQR